MTTLFRQSDQASDGLPTLNITEEKYGSYTANFELRVDTSQPASTSNSGAKSRGCGTPRHEKLPALTVKPMAA